MGPVDGPWARLGRKGLSAYPGVGVGWLTA